MLRKIYNWIKDNPDPPIDSQVALMAGIATSRRELLWAMTTIILFLGILLICGFIFG